MKTMAIARVFLAVLLMSAGFCKAGIAGNIINNVRIDGVTEIETGGGKSNVGAVIIDGVTEIETGDGKSNAGVVTGCVQGSGIRKTVQRKVSTFKAVRIDGAFDVHIELQKKQSVKITGDDNILPHIITTLAGDELTITAGKSICTKIGIQVRIVNNGIQKVTANGSSNILVSGISNENFGLHLDGSGDVRASGITKKFFTNIKGSGNILAGDLQAEEVRLSINGVGQAEVFASRKLEIEINGVGDIRYFGDPGEVVKNVSGVGSIEKGD